MNAPGRIAGGGWLAVLGGGEFSFGETLDLDRMWLERTPPGPIGFLPTASGSVDYGREFTAYLSEALEREVHILPVYRRRDALRAKNVQRVDEVAAVYIGGGVADTLIEVLTDSPVLAAIRSKLEGGGTVVAIAAAAQALGESVRSLRGRELLPAFGWLPGGVLEANFDPAHDRRLRLLLEGPEVQWGLGLPSGSALLLGPDQSAHLEGTAFKLTDPEGDFSILQ